MATLYYFSSGVEESLKDSVDENIDRYMGKGFAELATAEGWSVPLTVPSDLAALRDLKSGEGPDIEVFNSLVVWKALSKLTPALANEGRLWTRLSHIDCFQFASDRWMRKVKGPEATKSARAHFFGDTLTRRRDDNAIGRLWWNAYIARQAMPGNQHEGLKALLRSADIRLNLVERARTGRMPRLAGGLLRVVLQKPALAASETGFRAFMRNVNRLGGGVLFELMDPTEVDRWLERCFPAAAAS